MTQYRVLFAGRTPDNTTVDAAKINLGVKKLWFYDAQDQLIAVYQWDHLVGLDVVGSAAEQVFTESLLHERRSGSLPKQPHAIEQQGTIVLSLEEILESLSRTTTEIRRQWITVNDENKQKTKTALLVRQKEALLLELQAKIIDANRELQKVLDLLQMEFRDLGLPTLTLPTSTQPASSAPEPQEKKKKWLSS
jgi:hypothetical protein